MQEIPEEEWRREAGKKEKPMEKEPWSWLPVGATGAQSAGVLGTSAEEAFMLSQSTISLAIDGGGLYPRAFTIWHLLHALCLAV